MQSSHKLRNTYILVFSVQFSVYPTPTNSSNIATLHSLLFYPSLARDYEVNANERNLSSVTKGQLFPPLTLQRRRFTARVL